MKLNEIYLGDCLALMTKVPDKSVDMILCDLPYGTTACKWDVIIPFEPLWKQYERIIKDNGAIVLTASQPFTSALVMSNPKRFKYEWIWKKSRGSNFLQANFQPRKVHENILVFGKSPASFTKNGGKLSYYPILSINPNYKPDSSTNKPVSWEGRMAKGYELKINQETKHLKHPESVIAFKNIEHDHPTQKPVALFEYLIKTYTNEGETVMDNCSGSGTTAIACIRTNRNYICMEKELKYYELSKERVRKEIEQTKLSLQA